MKLKELTKEQRESIEKNHFYIELNCWRNSDPLTYGCGVFMTLRQELKRTIKRIDDEIEWINSELTGHIQILSEPVEDEFDRGYYGCTENIKRDFQIRIKEIKKQKQLYELMEQLE